MSSAQRGRCRGSVSRPRGSWASYTYWTHHACHARIPASGAVQRPAHASVPVRSEVAKGSRSSGGSYGIRRSTRTAAADWGRDAGEVKTVTTNRDFKQVVRRRMAQSGETYTAARAAVEQHDSPRMATPADPSEQLTYDAARGEQERLVGRLFTDGRLAHIPAKRKTRVAALLEVLTRFEPGRVYTEPDVNEVLLRVHEDFAYLRRELVNYRYLTRADGRYSVVSQSPVRAPIERQEIPAWEAFWLPRFLAGGE